MNWFQTKKVRRVRKVTVKVVKGKEERIIFVYNFAEGYPLEKYEDVIAEVETEEVKG